MKLYYYGNKVIVAAAALTVTGIALLADRYFSHIPEDAASCGGEGVFVTEGVCVKLEGTDYWLTDEEGYALLMKDYR